jgi:3-deoxy-manno-octulosonate cytidylyltransferase (CMP-KDO synthetase)
MLEEVWRRSRAADSIDRLVIATDDQRVFNAARDFGAEVLMTSQAHPTGTDRVAEVVRGAGAEYDVVLNIQGDEPLLTPTSIDRLSAVFCDATPPQMATLAEPIEDIDELFDPNVVKLVTDDDGRALYFSRSPIPFHRGAATRLSSDFRGALSRRKAGLEGYRKHQGIYAYTRDALHELTRLEPSPLELDEGLEQLRALQAGFAIRVVDSDFRSLSVDRPEDLEHAARRLAEQGDEETLEKPV